MALREEFEGTGEWMFRWRSYLPPILGALLIVPPLRFTYLGGSHGIDSMWDVLCIGVSLAGLAIRAITIGYVPERTSGRNTHGQVADTLNTRGMYSLVRHPLYLGNFMMWLGIALFQHNMYVVLVVALAFFLYYERIMFAEEAYLRRKFGAEFEAWASRTPAFLPRCFAWRAPELPFSSRNVLKREYSGLYAMVLIFTAMEVFGEYRVEGRLAIDPSWTAFLVTGTLLYLALRTLKKHTRILHVQGR